MGFEIVSGDVLPVLVVDITDANGAVDLTGASANLVLRNSDATAVYLNAACAVSGNTATYTWQPGDTDVAGDYVAEIVVTFADTTVQSFPTEGYFPVTIVPALTGTAKPRPTYLTTADVIAQARVYLDGRVRPGRNKLSAQIGTTDTSLSFAYDTAGAAQGLPISIGLETLYVWDGNGRGPYTVERGADGTIPSQHATGDPVLIDPEFTDAQILSAVNQTLNRLPSSGVYAVKAIDTTINSTQQGYDLADDVVSVLDVRWQDPIDGSQWTAMESFEVERNMPTDVFPSGVALFLPERPYLWPSPVQVSNNSGDTYKLRVRYRSTFTPLGTLFDDVLTVTGIPDSATDLLALGAAVRLMDGRAVQRVRNQSQPDPRDSAEVRVQDVLNSAAALRQTYQTRVQEEADKLSREQPYRKPARRLMGNNLRPFYRQGGW